MASRALGFLLASLFLAQVLAKDDIKPFKSASELELNFRKATPAELDRINQIFAKYEKFTDSNTTKLLAGRDELTIDNPSNLDLWNGASVKVLKIQDTAKVALTAYGEYTRQYGPLLDNIRYSLPMSFCPRESYRKCDPRYPYRYIDGSCNNLDYEWWGSSDSPYKRLARPNYDDKINSPRTKSVVRGRGLNNPRNIAKDLFTPRKTRSPYSTLFPYFGQFVAHDLSLIASSSYGDGRAKDCRCNTRDPDCFNIPTPRGDYYHYDQKCQVFVRSAPSIKDFECNLGHREQINMETHLIDLSHIYGSNDRVARSLRTYEYGLLKSDIDPLTHGPSLPYRGSKKCSGRYHLEKCYWTADKRAEDNPMLTFFQTVFVINHNNIAEALRAKNPSWDDERLYQEARRVNIAMYQHVVYYEYVPQILGYSTAAKFHLIPSYDQYSYGYDPKLNPQVSNEYAAAACRYGHLLMPQVQYHMNKDYEVTAEMAVKYYLFNQNMKEGVESKYAVQGATGSACYYAMAQTNHYMNHYLFNMTFPDKESKRFSLPALNIQRGRDHGLPGYNEYRKLCGLNYARSFDELYNIPAYARKKLSELYLNVNDIDLYAGAAAEYPMKDGVLGATFTCILAKQYYDSKFGDRFFYDNGHDEYTRFTPDQMTEIKKSSLAGFICQFTDVDYVQERPLYAPNEEYNRFINCKDVQVPDLSVFTDKY